MFAQRSRWWANISQALGQRLVLAGATGYRLTAEVNRQHSECVCI